MESRCCLDHVGKHTLKLPGRRGGMTSATPKSMLAGGRTRKRSSPAENTILKRLSLVWNEPDLSLEPLAVLADEYVDTEAPVQGGSRREIVRCHKLHLMMRL
jgi:hypothetical protein